MSKIHHNTVKRAAKLGLEVSEEGDHFVVSKDGKVLSEARDPKDALDLAILALNPPKIKKPRKVKSHKLVDDEEGDEEQESKSVVKHKYKTRYRPHKAKCGDDLSKLITAHVMVKDEETGEMRVDEERLIRFAKANGCWDPNYKKLNVGMQRMNIANRLRGKVRRDKHDIIWTN